MVVTVDEFNIDNMIFEDVNKLSTRGIYYQRIPVKYTMEGEPIDFCIETPELVTYGIQENKQWGTSDNDRPVESYSLPIVMSDKKSIEVFEQILKRCQDHLNDPDVKKALGKFQMTPEKMDIFYRKKVNGELVKGATPTMYPKLLTKYDPTRNKSVPPEITTEFYDLDSDELNASDLIGQKCKIIATIQVRDIYVGVNPSIQLKVTDVTVVEMLNKGHRKR